VLRLRRLIQEGRIQSATESRVDVQVSLADEDDFEHRGTINFLDNQVDPNTGTLRVRAAIDNADRLLSPGLFVRLRFPVGAPHKALLVQEEALGTDQGQRFLYVVNDKSEVVYRRVKVGMLISWRRVIEDGLQPQDRVVVNGLQRVRPGDKVTIKMSEAVSPASSGTGLAMAGAERADMPSSAAEPVSFDTRNTVQKPVDPEPPADAGYPPRGRER
jgi:membrane fusion protein, multidrug efflux system